MIISLSLSHSTLTITPSRTNSRPTTLRVNCEHAKHVLNFTESTPFDIGIKQTITFERKHSAHIFHKTILIPITRGMITRNILRGEAFRILKQQQNVRYVILIQNMLNTTPPEYLEQELGGDNVIFEYVANTQKPKLDRMFRTLVEFLVYTKSTKVFIQSKIEFERKSSRLTLFFINAFYTIASKITFLKHVARQIAWRFFHEKSLNYYFEKYKPDLVFSTAIISNLDIDCLHQAKRRNIKTVSMPKSWDNLDKILFRALPDIFLVQNELMKQQTVEYQAMDASTIHVVGFPQFDTYTLQEPHTKETYCGRYGFNPAFPILFCGSEGKWSNDDELIFHSIINARERGEIPPCNILIRPHFSNAPQHIYRELEKYQHVYIDNDFRKSTFFGDHWDPTETDTHEFSQSLHHCAMMITFASTLALDVSCFNKPIIFVNYGVRYVDVPASQNKMYESGHYEEVMNTEAASLATSYAHLIETINVYLKNPEHKTLERTRLREKMCGPLDGKSGARIAEKVIEYLNEETNRTM